ncbi:MAG: M20/M25/M40 family metallo-hydrolase [Pyrinomonadaceae bacterium]|nr:M20/M25/M40 family metallo-hydrolase [Pyrinomonadaceae bacterium]
MCVFKGIKFIGGDPTRLAEVRRKRGDIAAYLELHIEQGGTLDSEKVTTRLMPSGAGHDLQDMALLGPVGMIFVPSVAGISHSPREYSHPADIANGANVLLHTLLKLDQLKLN